MSNKEIEKVVREYITKTPHLSLATVSNDSPWVCEVHFAYDEGLNLYFVSKQTTRHCQEIAANPHIAGNIIKQHSLTESPNGIYFEGEAETIEASPQDIERYCSALNRNIAELTEMLQGTSGRRMYRIKVNHWAAFGNFDGNGAVKHELKWGQA